MSRRVDIRDARPEEFEALGRLVVSVYSNLEGFPDRNEQPEYYEMLANIGQFADRPDTRLLVAVSEDDELLGGVVYFSDMAQYGSGGTASRYRLRPYFAKYDMCRFWARASNQTSSSGGPEPRI